MTANISQAVLEAAGVSSMVEDLAAGSFHEGRESFHDYIYSRLILGEGKGHGLNIANPGAPVFPNADLSGSYPNTLPVVDSSYSNTGSHVESGGSNNSGGNKAFSGHPATKANTAEKPESSKKKSHSVDRGKAEQTGTGSGEGVVTKVKKKTYPKKKEKTNMCGVCGRGFAEKYTLNRHMLTHTRVKPYSCSKCSMSFSRSDGLAKHMAAGHRRTDAHHCDVCGGTFNSQVSYEQHRREYGSTLPFVCNLCMLAFSQCCHLNYHMKSHSLSKMNDSFCFNGQEDKGDAVDVSELIPDDFSPRKKDFISTDHMVNRHDSSIDLLDPNIIIKPEVEDFASCGAISSQISRNSLGQEALNAFSSVASTQGMGKFPGSQGESSLSATNSISAPSSLSDVSRNLSLSSSGEVDLVSDAEIKKYFNIKIPNPKFVEAYDLLMAPAGEDGLFRCGICGKGFTRKYHMQRHVKLHLRGPVPRAHLLDWTRRPYACGVCKMGFTRQHHLTRHMLIHTGERPHSCHICSKAFRRITNLSLHVRTVHGAERPFRCHICGRGFPRLYSLQRHLKLHAKKSAGLSSESKDQLHKGFKTVGTVDVHHSSHSTGDLNSIQQLPDNTQEPYSAGHSGNNERNVGESRVEGDTGAQITSQNKYIPVTERISVYQPHSEQHGQVMNQITGSQSGQGVDRPASSHPGQAVDRPISSQFDQAVDRPTSSHLGQAVDRLTSSHLSQAVDRLTSSHLSQAVDRLTSSLSGQAVDRGAAFSQTVDRPPSSLSNQAVDRPTSAHTSQAIDRPTVFSQAVDRLANSVDRLPQTGLMQHQVTSASDSRVQQNYLISASGEIMKIHNTALSLISNDVQQSPNNGEVMRNQIPVQTINTVDFNLQSSTQNTIEGRLVSGDAIPGKSMRTAAMLVSGNFNEQDLRETGSYSVNQRRGSGDGFIVHQRQIQSPHLMMNVLERPGSRSMVVNQATGSGGYHQNSVGYLQQQPSSQMQQHANMNLPATLGTVNSTSIHDTGSYSHNHQMNIGNSQSGISSSTVYSYNQSINSQTFPVGHLDMYHQQLSDNMNNMEAQQQPSNNASPLPVSSHNNSMQY